MPTRKPRIVKVAYIDIQGYASKKPDVGRKSINIYFEPPAAKILAAQLNLAVLGEANIILYFSRERRKKFAFKVQLTPKRRARGD